SPSHRGPSVIFKRECPQYVPTHLFPDVAPGAMKGEYRCEDLERQTFADNFFDVVVTQDVYEHIFNPDLATAEIFRTLKPGGISVLTTGVWKDKVTTEQWARLNPDGRIEYLVQPPEYHVNPISEGGTLVTFKYGYDFPELLAKWAPFN